MDRTSPTDLLDDVAYLARSPHRVTALARLADGPATRRALHDETGISQPTLGRLLDGFEARDWVACDRTNGRTYALTPVGELVADAFDGLLTAMGTAEELRAVADRLPLAEMDVDLQRFVDATVTVPSTTDTMAHMRREDELIEDADRVRFLCSSAFGPSIKAYRDRVVEGGLSFEAVISADALDAASADPETAAWVRDIAGADGVTIYRYEGPVTLMLGLIDEVASLVPLDDSGVPQAFIETADPVVRGWVEAELDAHRARSEPLAPEASTFTP